VTLSGFLVINKDAGVSSHAVVGRVRRLTGQKKAGHTGTLDPFATGVLPLALGEATKIIQFLDESVKEYRAVMRLGESTDTQDYTGTTLLKRDYSNVTATLLDHVASSFIGPIMQIPPMYSAIKQNGIPLYKMARKGEEVEREARSIHIHSLEIEDVSFPDVALKVNCSRGTYVRTLAHDIGETLGCGAHLVLLSRIRSGPFTMESAVTIDSLEESINAGELDNLLEPPIKFLSHFKAIHLSETSARRIKNGVAPSPDSILKGEWPENSERVMLMSDDSLLAIAEGISAESVRLLRVFA